MANGKLPEAKYSWRSRTTPEEQSPEVHAVTQLMKVGRSESQRIQLEKLRSWSGRSGQLELESTRRKKLRPCIYHQASADR